MGSNITVKKVSKTSISSNISFLIYVLLLVFLYMTVKNLAKILA